MRKAFVITSSLLLAAFALQFVFAAVGAFTKPGGEGAFALHSATGMAVIPVLNLLTIGFAALARAPGRLVGLTALPLGLVILQALLAGLANGLTDGAGVSTPFGLTVAGLHAVNGIVAVHVVVGVVRGARGLGRPAPAEAVPVTVREGEPA
ncbi:DUF6220 domain-containing protein [Micromonospora sp. MA102]|uniref:DUF6220 domain-containing protein n=1 Tax=Micromonospora sp. MA102 TaxID=2952755 RepID=UPI0021C8CF21|nr:DUF6220 domain-containing protein [Micromonospora sp. MA102]